MFEANDSHFGTGFVSKLTRNVHADYVKIHRELRLVAYFANLMDRHDIRVLQTRHGSGFFRETFDRLGAAQSGFWRAS